MSQCLAKGFKQACKPRSGVRQGMGSHSVLQSLVGPRIRTQSNVWVLYAGREVDLPKEAGVGGLHGFVSTCSTEALHPSPHPSPTAGGTPLNFSPTFLRQSF